MQQKTFQIFRAGQHKDMSGSVVSMSRSQLQSIARAYNTSLYSAPLQIGHARNPAPPSCGVVQSLDMLGDKLFATASVSDELVALVRDGTYQNRSASFMKPDAPGNPTPGEFYLDHVAFLGAQPPAVKGMEPLAFSEAPSRARALVADATARSLLQFSEATADAVGTCPLARDALRRSLATSGIHVHSVF
ncbi:GPO family capsid scaffolding protein [Paracidovorax anthurii]|uniref:Uncharacterized protein n=1 Tax=Paracidovorax anthurii TaxID=78229 RepID=A0A328YPE0_9BURK|nr:GPO family capsid scaffolding protein [Paracidovorax anthurii]RAR74022.1 hypothetical protein AX018_106817 [Paracidovorax anthurii]